MGITYISELILQRKKMGVERKVDQDSEENHGYFIYFMYVRTDFVKEKDGCWTKSRIEFVKKNYGY